MNSSASVVVTTRNSARTLEACLKSVRTQSVKSLELIVIDNFSRDDTPSIAKTYADHFQQAGPERSRQRNIGAGIAKNDYLLFLDSDMVLKPPIIQECLAFMHGEVGAVIIPEVSVGTGYWAACKAFERSFYLGDDSIEAPRFVSRLLFHELAGFDEHLTGTEDWDLGVRIRKAGVCIARTTTPLIHDEGRLTLRETVKSKFYYGRTAKRYVRKHPTYAKGQMTLLRPAFVRHRRELVRRPLLAGGMAIMKVCEAIAGGFGYLVGPEAYRANQVKLRQRG